MITNEFLIIATIIGSVLLFGGAAVWALAWAVRDGQFENFRRGACSIFDPDEPIGEPTDYFPGEGPARARRRPLPPPDGPNGSGHE